ncbi:MAG: hypothetical protein Q7R88_00190 [bacterium]|nr:hypothetical protein [bacterium]
MRRQLTQTPQSAAPARRSLFLLGLAPPTAVGVRARSASAECLL